MKLREHLVLTNQTAEQFAAQIGASRFAVGKWIRGERIPNRDVMAAIYEATNGAVTPNDFYNIAQHQDG